MKLSGVVDVFRINRVKNNGELLLKICVKNETALYNTFCKKRDIHISTQVRRARGNTVVRQQMDN